LSKLDQERLESRPDFASHKERSELCSQNTPGSFSGDPLAEKQAANPRTEVSEKHCRAFLKMKNRYCGKPVAPNQSVCAGHGGLSTGPRTKEGLARLAAIKTSHGRETRALRALRSKISHDLRHLEEVLYAEGLIHGPRTRGRKPTLWTLFIG
jgi:hypothetical protein